jgi:hypothetical protein
MLVESSESKKIASLATSVGLRAVLPTGAPTIESATSNHDQHCRQEAVPYYSPWFILMGKLI